MSMRVLVVQSQQKNAEVLARFFTNRGDTVRKVSSADQAAPLVGEFKPELVLIDLHLPGNTWLDLIHTLHQKHPYAQIIVTNRIPDLQREMLAGEQGVRIFLREPFTDRWIQLALDRLKEPGQSRPWQVGLPLLSTRVRMPVRLKITLPYALLALLVMLAAIYLVSQLVLEAVQARFTSQLVDTGKQAADWMVREEDRLLETLRLVSNTRELVNAIQAGDIETLRTVVLPVAVNAREESIEILSPQGVSLLSLRHVPGTGLSDYESVRGDSIFQQWDFVRPVLAHQVDKGRDKYAGLAQAPWGSYFYVSGPILLPDGTLAGVVLVGKSLATLVRQVSQENLAAVTYYGTDGRLLVSSLFSSTQQGQALSPQQAQDILNSQDQASSMRDLTTPDNRYGEVLGAWEARGGQDLGVMGVALPKLFLVRSSRVTQMQVYLLMAGAFLLVILVGITLSSQITRPLLRVVSASSEVARGNLEVKVEPQGNDEVAVLTRSFNYMVAGLQEGSIYRDLLGRTVSPEVREQLRQTFVSGNLHLEGQEAVGTVLMSDIRGFTALSERADPATVFSWLNEYFAELVPIITSNGGVVNKFDGDAMLAFFGILPRMLNPRESAYSACQAALGMLNAIEQLNARRIERGEAQLLTGIGINTGVITAGGLGTSDRLHYTIIGDTVNTTQRLEGLTRQLFNTTGAVISQTTYLALGEHRREFRLEPLGPHIVKGKAEQLQVFRLLPLESLRTETRGVTI